MAAVRKSDVSVTGGWFRRGSTSSLRERRTSQGSMMSNDSTLATEPSLVPQKDNSVPRTMYLPLLKQGYKVRQHKKTLISQQSPIEDKEVFNQIHSTCL